MHDANISNNLSSSVYAGARRSQPAPRAALQESMPSADLSQQGQLELVLDLNGELLEGPIWDERIKKLHFVDINRQQIHTFDPHEPSDAGRRAISSNHVASDLYAVKCHRTLYIRS